METTFWTAVTIYYAALIGAITVQPAMISVTLILFFLIPSFTETELMPGIETVIQSQLEVIETQQWLKKQGYYQ